MYIICILTEHRGRPMGRHGIPWLFPRYSTDTPRATADTPRASTGIPWASTECRGMSRNPVEAHGTSHGNLHGNLHGNPRQAPTAYHGSPRYNGKTRGNAYGMEVAMEYAVAVAVVPRWVTMVGITEVGTDRTAAHAMATTVALAVESPCTMESRRPCRRNPRFSR